MEHLKTVLAVTDKEFSFPKTRELLQYSKNLREAKEQMAPLEEIVMVTRVLAEQGGPLSEEDQAKFDTIQNEYEKVKESLAKFEADFENTEGSKYERFIDLVKAESKELLYKLDSVEDGAVIGGQTKEYLSYLYSAIIVDIDSIDSLDYLMEKSVKSKIRNYSGKKMIPYLVKKAKSKLSASKYTYLDPSLLKDRLLNFTTLSEKQVDRFVREFLIYVISAKVDTEQVYYKISETISTIVKLDEFKDKMIHQKLELNIQKYLAA